MNGFGEFFKRKGFFGKDVVTLAECGDDHFRMKAARRGIDKKIESARIEELAVILVNLAAELFGCVLAAFGQIVRDCGDPEALPVALDLVCVDAAAAPAETGDPDVDDGVAHNWCF